MDVYCAVMKKVINMLYKKEHTETTEKTNNGAISTETMVFFKPLGPNSTVIIVVSGKTGREQNCPGREILVIFFNKLAALGRF